jgi:hypothetical protein
VSGSSLHSLLWSSSLSAVPKAWVSREGGPTERSIERAGAIQGEQSPTSSEVASERAEAQRDSRHDSTACTWAGAIEAVEMSTAPPLLSGWVRVWLLGSAGERRDWHSTTAVLVG